MLQGEVYIAQGEPIIAAAVVETFTSRCADCAASGSEIVVKKRAEGINTVYVFSYLFIKTIL